MGANQRPPADPQVAVQGGQGGEEEGGGGGEEAPGRGAEGKARSALEEEDVRVRPGADERLGAQSPGGCGRRGAARVWRGRDPRGVRWGRGAPPPTLRPAELHVAAL